jgi:two-component system response regulator CpxR
LEQGPQMILVVDDFRDAAEALCRLIKASGYPCEIALSGTETLARMRAHPSEQPLLVILDMMMPGMDGIETLREIRSDPRIAHAAVVFLTAGFDVAKRAEAITLGALAWLYKGGSGMLDVGETIKEIVRMYESVGGAKVT